MDSRKKLQIATAILAAVPILTGAFAMMGVEFFMSIMFPTIFALGIKDLGDETKTGSSYMVMSIVGGAIIPLALGYISRNFNMQVAYIVPLICFFFVFYFGIYGYKIKTPALKLA